MMFKLPTRRLTTQLINKQKVLISGKYFFVYSDVYDKFTVCLRDYNRQYRVWAKKVDNLLGDDCHMCQSRKIEKQVI